MRRFTILVLALSSAFGPAAIGTAARAEYFCSAGFEPASGGRCAATVARDEVQLYLNDTGPRVAPQARQRHRRHRPAP